MHFQKETSNLDISVGRTGYLRNIYYLHNAPFSVDWAHMIDFQNQHGIVALSHYTYSKRNKGLISSFHHISMAAVKVCLQVDFHCVL